MSKIGNSLGGAWDKFANAAEFLTPNTLANKAVEAGHFGLGVVGGIGGAGLGLAASVKGSALLWEHANPFTTLSTIPGNAAAQTNAMQSAVQVGSDVLKAGVEFGMLGLMINVGVQSADALVKLAQQTKPNYVKIKDETPNA